MVSEPRMDKGREAFREADTFLAIAARSGVVRERAQVREGGREEGVRLGVMV